MSAVGTIKQPIAAERSGVRPERDRLAFLKLLTLAAVVGLAVAAYLALVYAGPDALQGNVQRVFYFHVAAFSAASVAFFMGVVGGIAYLRTRAVKWDTLALAGIEVGFALSLITLFTGMVWARPIWNTWWTWDPRLTSAAIMCLTYAAYLMLRSAIENPDKRRAFASVYGIFAFATVIITYMITRIRPDTIHPTVIGSSPQNAQGGFAMTSTMTAALAVGSLVWCCLIAPTLVWWRIRLENLIERAAALRAALES
ncbi:MAG: cytochrome c biogenesis protein CcsA [Anaerolineae bacterium]|nr:cytochrome c biogenesis protein CcsA [Anaerolineae bacterium]NUQ04926.1 cytochrome c biogenesis protein CcsA [Anaerolineae bacterium]